MRRNLFMTFLYKVLILSNICIPQEQVEKIVFEKYDDYKYSYDNHYGLGLINGPSNFNDVSNYFHQDLRLECGSYGFRAPKEVWENGNFVYLHMIFGSVLVLSGEA